MIEKVRSYIEREIGLKVCSDKTASESIPPVLVAISGGADSTALLLIMKELGFKLHALHCNFHLRGEESDRDQAFVEELCRRQEVSLSVHHFQTEKEAKRRGISIEMAARDLRYGWFRDELKRLQASCIAVAHHQDDQAETLLLNLLRGTGLRGLSGMMPRHDDIIRPLLCLSREEIIAYLENKGQTYVTDSTNGERVALRNRLRLDVMPLLRSISPSATRHLCLAADNVRQSLPFYIKGIESAFRELGITEAVFPLSVFSVASLDASPSTLLHEWLAGKMFNAAQEEEIMQSSDTQPGRMWHSATHTVLRDRTALLLSLRYQSDVQKPPQLVQETVQRIDETGANIAYFDADLLTKPIEVRPVREGDFFVPFGMTGRKLVSDYLTDRKLNRLQKAETFVAICGDDIIWLIGHRSDNRYRVTDKTTHILKLICRP